MLSWTTTVTRRRLAQFALCRRPVSSNSLPKELSEGERAIHAKLTERFTPSELLVQDVSGGCGSFYAITIASRAFNGLSTVKQHRLVTETLKKEIEALHGLQIKTIPE